MVDLIGPVPLIFVLHVLFGAKVTARALKQSGLSQNDRMLGVEVGPLGI